MAGWMLWESSGWSSKIVCPVSKKETQAFLGTVDFAGCIFHEIVKTVSPLCHVTRENNSFRWDPEWQQQVLDKLNRRLFVQQPLGQSEQDKIWKMCSTLHLGSMVLPGVSDKKYPWRLEDSLDSGFSDKEDLRPVTSRGILAGYKGVGVASEVADTEALCFLAPWLTVLDGMSKENSILHIVSLMPCGISGSLWPHSELK